MEWALTNVSGVNSMGTHECRPYEWCGRSQVWVVMSVGGVSSVGAYKCKQHSAKQE